MEGPGAAAPPAARMRCRDPRGRHALRPAGPPVRPTAPHATPKRTRFRAGPPSGSREQAGRPAGAAATPGEVWDGARAETHAPAVRGETQGGWRRRARSDAASRQGPSGHARLWHRICAKPADFRGSGASELCEGRAPAVPPLCTGRGAGRPVTRSSSRERRRKSARGQQGPLPPECPRPEHPAQTRTGEHQVGAGPRAPPL